MGGRRAFCLVYFRDFVWESVRIFKCRESHWLKWDFEGVNDVQAMGFGGCHSPRCFVLSAINNIPVHVPGGSCPPLATFPSAGFKNSL